MKKYFLIFIIINSIINICRSEQNTSILSDINSVLSEQNTSILSSINSLIPNNNTESYPVSPEVTRTPTPAPDGYPYYSTILQSYTNFPFP